MEPQASHEKHERTGEKYEQCGTVIGFFYDKDNTEHQHGQGRKKSLEVVDFFFFLIQIMGQIENKAEFCQFRGLETQSEKDDPAVGAANGRHEKADGQENERKHQQSVYKSLILIEGTLPGYYKSDYDKADSDSDELMD